MKEKLLELQELIECINYPGGNTKHLSYYTEKASELMCEIVYEYDKINNNDNY